jgi:hypothetical protein
VTDHRTQIRRPSSGGIPRSRAMLLSSAILACSAAMIAIERRGLVDLDYYPKEALAWSGIALALGGFAILVRLWCAERFRITISRLMVIVAMVAILIAFVLHMLRVEQQRRGPGLPPRTSPAGVQGQVSALRSVADV